jgi:predicted nucleotidyltransferase
MDKINEFCIKWKIIEFSLFGSVLGDEFRPDSDIDVLVAFSNDARWDLFDLVEMKDELKGIFGREIDLVEKGTIRNPFREDAIMTSREVLYAA